MSVLWNKLPQGVLGIFACAIWVLDLSWYRQTPDALMIILLLPLAFFLARKAPGPARAVSAAFIYRMTLLLGLGVVANSIVLMAFSWAGLASALFFRATAIPRSRLWLVCMGAFPWVLIDLHQVGWLFRLSGAWVTGVFYDLIGSTVRIEGTQLLIDGLRISVEAACGGMQLLQVLLSGGVALTLIQFPRGRGFWRLILMLPVLAWVANTVRIIVICAWGLHYGVESAEGAFHTWGAMLVVVLMLGCYVLASNWTQRSLAKGSSL
ncbi:MAG: exosortase/archaeosortase family protein [Lentimonas sp.]|jgi:exosortase/archaeosortase family protein